MYNRSNYLSAPSSKCPPLKKRPSPCLENCPGAYSKHYGTNDTIFKWRILLPSIIRQETKVLSDQFLENGKNLIFHTKTPLNHLMIVSKICDLIQVIYCIVLYHHAKDQKFLMTISHSQSFGLFTLIALHKRYVTSISRNNKAIDLG